ncbi:hypothetical protein FOCC_FOCC011437 [Frankliniella occidentalis]|nr:hypothetical protein FOCC_FOCC011437 [Frankliniella occidentalis]
MCGKVLKRGSLRKHMVDRHSDNVQASTCQYCNKHFRTANSLSNHLSLYHRELTQAAKRQRQPGPGPGALGQTGVALGSGRAALVTSPGVALAAGGCGPMGPAAVPVITHMQPPQYLPMAPLEIVLFAFN